MKKRETKMSLANLIFEKIFYVECQECEERMEGETKNEVREKLKTDNWLTKAWCPKGYDTEFDLLCHPCVELYSDTDK